MNSSIFAIICLLFSLSFSLPLPPSGLYLSFSDVGLGGVASTVTTDVETEINAYTGWQTISGSSSSASYTFSSWKVDIALVGPQWKDVTATEFLIGWKEFNFSISANYHICANSWPNPCEDGNLYIYTTDSYTKLFLDTILDLSQSPPFANVSAADLSFRNDGIEIYVQCSNTFCLIPVDDIAQAVADNFQTLFQAAVAKSARTSLETLIGKFKTEFVFADGLALDLESDWWFLPGNTGGENGLIIVPSAGGFYTDVSGTVTNPPFPPSFNPPINYLQDPLQDFNIVITEYFFQSLTWALGSLNFFNKVITAAEVPSASPVQLHTSDPFFQQVVPGLVSYPNMDITVTSSLNGISVPTIDTAGLHATGTVLTFDFALSNSSYSKHGWTLSNTFDIDFKLVTTVSGNTIIFNASISNFNSTVSVIESDLGNVTADGFNTLYQLLESVIKVPGFAITLPETFEVSNPSLTFFDQYIGFGADFSYSQAPPSFDKFKLNPSSVSITW